MNISPETDLTYFPVSGHLWFFSCVSKSRTSKCYARHPTISRYRRCFFLWSIIWYTLSGTLSYSTLYRTDMATCHSWLWQCVARNASDPPQYQAPLIHNHTTFKCFIAFSNIITSCDMPTCILFAIHLFSNAWRLIICLSEHRTFVSRCALNAHWSVTN